MIKYGSVENSVTNYGYKCLIVKLFESINVDYIFCLVMSGIWISLVLCCLNKIMSSITNPTIEVAMKPQD